MLGDRFCYPQHGSPHHLYLQLVQPAGTSHHHQPGQWVPRLWRPDSTYRHLHCRAASTVRWWWSHRQQWQRPPWQVPHEAVQAPLHSMHKLTPTCTLSNNTMAYTHTHTLACKRIGTHALIHATINANTVCNTSPSQCASCVVSRL